MKLWTITEPGNPFANDFYFTREEAEAALDYARRYDNWHPDDVTAQRLEQGRGRKPA